ncbi:MAG TPA: type IX secretion system membrane protein PorP/SprF [Bacteroidia bacterium]|nr:type IX secretion system membrane protein PorP/SprF [Bacteroidia bacterium]
MRKQLLLLIALAPLLLISQQDPQYSLYQFNQLIINPAYAGARNGLSATGSVRQQWAGVEGSPMTSCFSAHTPLQDKNLGVGGTLIYDQLGPKSTIGLYGTAAYILNFAKEWKLSFGISAGYNRYQFRTDQITMFVAENSNVFTQDLVTNSLDLGSGFYLRRENFFIGISGTHLNSPKVYDYSVKSGSMIYDVRLKTHMFVTAGYSFKLNDEFIFAPTTLVKFVNGQAGVDLNLNFLFNKKLWMGLFFRAGYGPGALLQYHITQQFRIAYSYDTGIKDARRLGGSHEIVLGFDMGPKKVKIVNPRFL